MRSTQILGLAALTLFVNSTLSATDYFVSKQGSDENPGTQAEPFLTLEKVASVGTAGDICYIGEGIYEETLVPQNSGTEENALIFTSFPGQKVIITAMQAIETWTADPELENVYTTVVDWDLEQENLIMVGDRVCDLARWPNNSDNNLFTLDAVRNDGGSAGSVTENAYLDYEGIPAFQWQEGGSILFYGDSAGSGWTTWRAFITGTDENRVYFTLPSSWVGSAHAPEDGGEFFLQGIKEAIDAPYEWWLDSATGTLFLQLPEGITPEDVNISMRRRKEAINLDTLQYVQIRDLAVFGGSIELKDRASNNLIHRVSSFYGNHTIGVVDSHSTGQSSINIRGNDNWINQCEIAWGAATGVWIGAQYWDETDGLRNIVSNCNIHDFNYLGNYDAPVMIRGSRYTTLTQNTIFRGGRDCIQSVDRNATISYNDVHQSNLIANDCGLLYTLGGPKNTTIHHNWFHDTWGRGSHYKACGIYLDNDSNDFDVYRNVVWNTEWTSIQINWNGIDLNIFNNTLWNGQHVMGAWHMDGTAFDNVLVYNNIANDDSWEPQSDKQNNLDFTDGTDPFVNVTAGNFQLTEASAPVDAGRVIEGFIEAYEGTSPDVGAYELGGAAWVAGINWDSTKGPADLGEYGLPGEPYGFKMRKPWHRFPLTIPCTIECEDFDYGLAEVAYHDESVGNSGNAYRFLPEEATEENPEPEADATARVDLYELENGAIVVADTQANEWMEYTSFNPTLDPYHLTVTYATAAAVTEAGTITVAINGETLEATIELPTTEDENTFATASIPVRMDVGRKTIRLTASSEGLILDKFAVLTAE